MAPPLSARQKERQRGRRPGKDVDTATSDATWAASLDGDEQDEGAPFAVLEADGEGRGSRGLQALLRLLERKEPSFLLEEDGAASGGSGGASVGEAAGAGILDSELDSFLSMPAASDLSVVPSPPPPAQPGISLLPSCSGFRIFLRVHHVLVHVCTCVCV